MHDITMAVLLFNFKSIWSKVPVTSQLWAGSLSNLRPHPEENILISIAYNSPTHKGTLADIIKEDKHILYVFFPLSFNMHFHSDRQEWYDFKWILTISGVKSTASFKVFLYCFTYYVPAHKRKILTHRIAFSQKMDHLLHSDMEKVKKKTLKCNK